MKLLTEELFVSAPASKPDVWHVEADVKSLRVYWKVSFIIGTNGGGFGFLLLPEDVSERSSNRSPVALN